MAHSFTELRIKELISDRWTETETVTTKAPLGALVQVVGATDTIHRLLLGTDRGAVCLENISVKSYFCGLITALQT